MTKARYLYSELAALVQARRNCQESNNAEWFDEHSNRINELVQNFMPSGSGWDCGTKIDLDASHAEKLVFYGEYHHMEDGYYDGWTEHTVTVTPSFQGINIRISGRNRNEIKDYLYETFDLCLKRRIVQAETEPYAYSYACSHGDHLPLTRADGTVICSECCQSLETVTK